MAGPKKIEPTDKQLVRPKEHTINDKSIVPQLHHNLRLYTYVRSYFKNYRNIYLIIACTLQSLKYFWVRLQTL